ncbi:MAG TPA: penicillin-binding protein activator LpoB [Pseudomonadales bacterium]|nr:penicillin-binding protein activator LpoB [Pseudomonadales bacterium]
MKPSRWLVVTWIVVLHAALLSGCSSSSVNRIDTDETVDLSGGWNDTDSRLVSEEMVGDLLSHPWVAKHHNSTGKNPTVIVGTLTNLSHEHINVATFIGDIERQLINSGKVEFVASSYERDEIRDERDDQREYASKQTAKPMGREIGADYMLKGVINTILDTQGKTQVRYYQVDLTLISLKDNKKIWVGQKKIKKMVKKPNMRW